MYNDFFQVLNQTVCTVAVNFIFFMFFKNHYGCKYKSFRVYVLGFSLWTALMILINHFQNPPLNMLYGFVSSELICVLLYQTTVKKSWLCNTLLFFIQIFCDAITIFMWSALLGKSTDDIYANVQLTVISNWLNVLTFYIMCRIFLLIVSKSEFKELRIKETVFLLLITVFEIYVVYNFTLKMTTQIDGFVVVSFLIAFLLFNVYITYLLKNLADSYEYKYEISLLNKQNEMQLEYYKDIDSKYNQSRKIIHDMKKHFQVYRDLKDDEDPEAYRTMMESEMDKLFRGFQCTNTILSIIISQKCILAESSRIEVNIRMEDLSLSFINDLDITAIFANLWDNAIEASKTLPLELRKIDFVLRKVNGFVLINMQNACLGDVQIHGGKIASSKKGHMGLGLSIIESAVKKYNGIFRINSGEKGKFIVELTIPILQDCVVEAH